MAVDQALYRNFRRLNREIRDALSERGEVSAPREFQFDVKLGDADYLFRLGADEKRVQVGEAVGVRGVEWFDELVFDSVSNGWRSASGSAWEFAQDLADHPPKAAQRRAYAKAARSRPAAKAEPGLLERMPTGAIRGLQAAGAAVLMVIPAYFAYRAYGEYREKRAQREARETGAGAAYRMYRANRAQRQSHEDSSAW
jgi:hypothetical protein